MPTSDAVKVALAFYNVYNNQMTDLLDDILDPLYVGHVNSTDIIGPDSAKEFISGFLEGIPDAFFDVKNILEDGNHVICRWRCTGSQTGPFYGISPTNRAVDVNGITIFRINTGRIAELWNIWDQHTFLTQIKA